MGVGKKYLFGSDLVEIVIDDFRDMSDKKLVKRVLEYYRCLNNKSRYPFYSDKKSETYVNLLNFVYGLGELVKRKLHITGKRASKHDVEDFVLSLVPDTDRSIITLTKINSHIIENKLWKRELPFKKIVTDDILKERIRDRNILSEFDYND